MSAMNAALSISVGVLLLYVTRRHAKSVQAVDTVASTTKEASLDSIKKPEVEILFCNKCRWWLRAGWVAQELLATFGDELGQVRLTPGPSGTFKVLGRQSNDDPMILLWDRVDDGGFPDAKILKGRLRNKIMPSVQLGKCLSK